MRFYALLGDLRAFVVRHSNCLESGSTKHGKFQTYAKRDLDTCTWHVGSQPGRLFHSWWLILKVHHLVLSQIWLTKRVSS